MKVLFAVILSLSLFSIATESVAMDFNEEEVHYESIMDAPEGFGANTPVLGCFPGPNTPVGVGHTCSLYNRDPVGCRRIGCVWDWMR